MAASDKDPTTIAFRGAVRLPDLKVDWVNFSQENLLKLAGTRQFERGYRMRAISDGELAFPSFKAAYNRGIVLTEIIKRQYPVYVGVDLASEKRPGNCIVAVALDPSTHIRYPVEVLHGAWTSPETAGHVASVSARHNTQIINVENNAYQQSLIDWIQKEKKDFPHWYKVEAHTTGKNKADPAYGLPGLEVELKNNAWAVPVGEWEGHDAICACSWCEWSRQMAIYPRGAQTDFVMATWFANSAINQWGAVHRVHALKNLNRR